ncbi:MAG: hypothetical protein WEA76_01500 [Acidimicrobiia bacterium]
MRTLLLVIHIGAAAAWFGHKLTIPREIRSSLATGGGVAEAMVQRLSVTARLGISSAVVTVLSGIGLLWSAGWTASAVLGVGIMAAIGAIALGAGAARPAWAGLASAVEEGDLALAGAFGRRFARFLHLENLLWLAALVAMVAG